MKRRIGLCSALLIGLLFTVNLSWAANVQMSASIGFRGVVLPGRWVPLWVSVKGAPKDAVIEVTRQSFRGVVERYPCAIPSTRGALFELPFYAPETGDVATVKLVAGGQVLAEQRLKTYESIFPGHLFLAVQTPTQVEQSVGGALANEPIKVVSTTSAELPSMIFDYDSISGLILTDPNLALNPAQRRALRYWLMGGGKLFITPEAAAVLGNDFFPPTSRRTPYGRSYEMGLGRVILSERELSLLPWIDRPESWQEALNLLPYTRSFRLTPSIFATDEKKPSDRPISPIFLVFLTIWGGASLTIVIFLPPKRRMLLLLAVSVITALLAVPFGRFQLKEWRRGAVMHSHILILPEREGLFLTYIQLPQTKAWDAKGIKASPWGVSIGTNRTDSGTIYPLFKRVEWTHRTVMPFCHVMTASSDRLCLAGSLDQRFIDDAFKTGKLPAAVAKWENKRWYITDSSVRPLHWRRVQRIPHWLVGERPWINRMMMTAPDRPWLFGRGMTPNLGLNLQGGSDHEVIWAALGSRGEKP